MNLVVVTPVFEDVSAASQLVRDLVALANQQQYQLHIIAVDDGSLDEPFEATVFRGIGCAGTVVTLTRNLGHQGAIAVGLHYGSAHFPEADAYVVMDSDGEDRPRAIPALLDLLEDSTSEVIVARRRARSENLLFRMFYVAYRWLFSLLTGRSITFGNFMAMTPRALTRLLAMHELWTHLAASVLASRLPIGFSDTNRGRRYDGTSKMNFVGLVTHGFKSLMIFAEEVLVRVGVICILAALLSVIGMATAVILKILGFATPGWASTVFGLQLLIFLQTGAITLMTLMLTGVAKGSVQQRVDYQELVARIDTVAGATVDD